MNGQVNVLISTYNGEKYIAEQIESIKKQTYSNICIYVRDDGSTDRTIEILREYAQRKEIKLYTGKNLGFGQSFMRLLRHADEGEYWAFCDQDDVWFPQKVEWSLEWLDKHKDKPALVGNAYVLTNEDLSKTIGENIPPTYKFNFRRALTDCLYQGFVMTINRPLRELMLQGDDSHLESHDWWAVILAEKFGESYFDCRIAAKHRRLDQSISVMTFSNRAKWFWKTLKTGNTSIKKCAKEYVRLFGDMKDKEAKYAQWFAHDHYNLFDSVKKAFYPGRWRPAIDSEIIVRMLMLIGKI